MQRPPCIMRQIVPLFGAHYQYLCIHPGRPFPNPIFFEPDGRCSACPLRQETGDAPAFVTPRLADYLKPEVAPGDSLGPTGPTGPTGPVSLPPSVPRPDLAAIELTLPADKPEADRTFKPPIFHDDGSIEYPKAEKDWEPPRDINGYVRDPNNKWLFHPLWPVCGLRYQMAFLKANCGCIDVIMRCNNPQSPEFGARLAHETCAKCPVRVK